MATGYRWSTSRLRYLDARGRLVPETTIRKAVDAYAQESADRLVALTQRLQDGELDIPTWRFEMAKEIKMVHTATAMIAHGGRNAMTPSDWGYVGQIIRKQYAFLNRFADALTTQAIPMDDRVLRRASLYGHTARLTFEQVRERDARLAGFDQERNRLGAAERHCTECPSLSKRGWVVSGTLPQIGDRQCRLGCKCVIERRIAPEAA